MLLEMSLPYWQDKTFKGKVIFVSPTLDPETRTLHARLEIPNPELLLRPGMYGNASLSYSLGEKLGIPAEAVMFSGKQTYAFKEGDDGHLIPTRIQVGARGDGWYEVLSGLNEGDRIVVSANFLVDSESSLKAALEAMSSGADSTRPRDEHQGHQR
jgi:Cu(I)/Ag(I) efflux system membrane fusion protein